MKLSISKKFCKRSIKCLAMFAPLAYLFGSLFFYFNGAHGNVAFAPDNQYLDPSSLVFAGDSSFTPTNDYFSLSNLRGSSVVALGEIVSVASSSVSFADTTLYLGGDVLRSAGDIYDFKSSDGLIHRNVGVVDLGTLNWNYASDTGAWYAEFTGGDNSSLTTGGCECICNKYVVNNTPVYAELIASDKIINVNTSAFSSSGNLIVVMDSSLGSSTSPTGTLNYELATPTTEQGTPFDSTPFWSSSPVSFSFDSNINQPSVWLDYQTVVPKPDGDIEKIGLSFFGKDNFLVQWGENAISVSPKGFAPFGTFIKFIDDNMLHLSDSQIGLMAYGYLYYTLHVLIAFFAFDILGFIPLFLQRVTDKIGGTEDD